MIYVHVYCAYNVPRDTIHGCRGWAFIILTSFATNEPAAARSRAVQGAQSQTLGEWEWERLAISVIGRVSAICRSLIQWYGSDKTRNESLDIFTLLILQTWAKMSFFSVDVHQPYKLKLLFSTGHHYYSYSLFLSAAQVQCPSDILIQTPTLSSRIGSRCSLPQKYK